MVGGVISQPDISCIQDGPLEKRQQIEQLSKRVSDYNTKGEQLLMLIVWKESNQSVVVLYLQ